MSVSLLPRAFVSKKQFGFRLSPLSGEMALSNPIGRYDSQIYEAISNQGKIVLGFSRL